MPQLYTNGTILTMEDAQPVAQAVVVENGIIAYAGGEREATERYPHAECVDLRGKTLLPAFIDAHSHLSSAASALLQADLTGCEALDELADRLKAFLATLAQGDWLIGRGYDHNALAKGAHPTRAFLDACCPARPAVLQHASGHAGVFNSPALESLGVTALTAAPAGGRIDYETGYMEENAFFAFFKRVPMPEPERLLTAYADAQQLYLSHGVTTVQDGYAVREMIPLYQALLEKKLLKLDVVAYAGMENGATFASAFPEYERGCRRHFRVGGYKIFLDGSPQARTAWMRSPYLGEESYRGYGAMTDQAVAAAVRTAATEGRQLLAHCNGDAAAAQYLRALETVRRETGMSAYRPVMIHAQLLGLDQLEAVRRLNVIPSFFAAHVWHWGDAHIQNFGLERASRISPAASALKAGIRFTFHQDTPVVAPDMLETVWCAAARRTKRGVTLGAQERISVREALKAVTLNAAYQYGEECAKGSIVAGKRADFAILSANPLTVETDAIRDIRVLKTVKDGRTLFAREG